MRTTAPHRHRYRTVRDANGRDLGGCCLGCGSLLLGAKLRPGEDALLEAASLGLLIREEEGSVELGIDARRTLQARRRRLARQARADG